PAIPNRLTISQTAPRTRFLLRTTPNAPPSVRMVKNPNAMASGVNPPITMNTPFLAKMRGPSALSDEPRLSTRLLVTDRRDCGGGDLFRLVGGAGLTATVARHTEHHIRHEGVPRQQHQRLGDVLDEVA